jgi:hypothetical protein
LPRNAARGGELGAMALTVVEVEGKTGEAALARQREDGGGIEAAGEQNNGARARR